MTLHNFTAFVAEEIGGYGSQHFSKQLNQMKLAMFNLRNDRYRNQMGK
jgi:Zn-dependent M28 family amino/carboxypeptidase